MTIRLKCLLVGILAVAGCATHPLPSASTPAPQFPSDGFITQRAILTARGKQFTLNGYLSLSAGGGKRLLVTENFGNVLADVLVKPDRSIYVMRSSAAFQPAWIRRFVASDLECIFGNGTGENCHVERLSPTHFVVKRFWYKLDLRVVEIRPGPQPAGMFDEKMAP